MNTDIRLVVVLTVVALVLAVALHAGPFAIPRGAHRALPHSLPLLRPTGSETTMSTTDQTTAMPAQPDQPDADFLASLDRPYVDDAAPAHAADPEADSTGETPFDQGALERTVLDSLDRLLTAMIEKSGTATHHAVRVRRDLNITASVVEAIRMALQSGQITLCEATTAVHSGEPLL